MASPTGVDVVNEAMKFLGKPYVYGAAGPNSFDCSGLVQYVYKQVGLSVPRTSSEQYAAGINLLNTVPPGFPAAASQANTLLSPGDLITSEWPGDDVPHHGHVAIYAGHDMLIEAPAPGQTVHLVPLDTDYLSHVDGIVHMPGVGYASNEAVGSTVLANFLKADIGNQLGKFNAGVAKAVGAGATAGAQATASASSDVVAGLAPIGNFFSSITGDLTTVLHLIVMFFQPSTYIRLGAGLLGFLLLLGAVFVMARSGGTA